MSESPPRYVALLVLAAAASLVLAGARAPGGHAGRCAESGPGCARSAPVAALDPVATARLWRRLVHGRRPAAADDSCRPLRGVFYASTDWLGLATKLAAHASPCAQYYISIPPLNRDKTVPRPDQAWRIRALGPNFHAMADMQLAAWSKWIAANGSNYYDAGVTARGRMLAAGYDVSAGDIWAVNELPSAVRRNRGNMRANVRDFLHGLYDGLSGPPLRGAVFVVGVDQPLLDAAQYQGTLQNWFADVGFWTDMATYVSDWSQEVYADYRSYAVPGASIQTRRNYLMDYQEYPLVLANAGPATIAPARTFLQSAYSPLANAAWNWPYRYGWTMIGFDRMQAFVSAQTYALRYFDAKAGLPQDHWGFTWSPQNTSGLPAQMFADQTSAILDQLGTAIQASGDEADPNDPGSAACGPPGQNLSCGGDLQGARFVEAWKSFRDWSEPVLSFGPLPLTLTAGSVSQPLTVTQLMSGGGPQAAAGPVGVTLSSSSRRGQFSTSPDGPWSGTLAVTIAPGASTSSPFYYRDTLAGSPELEGAASGLTSAAQVEKINPGPVAAVRVSPSSASLGTRGTMQFGSTAVDRFGNAVAAAPHWTVDPAALGTVLPTIVGGTFTAGDRGGSGRVVATVSAGGGTASGGASLTVRPGRLRISTISYALSGNTLRVVVAAVDARGNPVRRASVSAVIRRDGTRVREAGGRTSARGRIVLGVRADRGACYTTAIASAAAPGLIWDGSSPRNRFCT